MSRIFLSHSSQDNREALALKQWLSAQRPELATEIFLDIDPASGLQMGARWKGQLFDSIGARFPVKTKAPKAPAPAAAAALSEEAATARQLAKEMAKKQGKVVVNLGGTGEVADAINVNPLTDQAVKNIPNLVKAGAERVGTLFESGSVDSIVSNDIVRGQLNWMEAAKGAFTALKSGGKVSIAPYAGQIEAHLTEIKNALTAAGFKDVAVLGGRVVQAVKP